MFQHYVIIKNLPDQYNISRDEQLIGTVRSIGRSLIASRRKMRHRKIKAEKRTLRYDLHDEGLWIKRDRMEDRIANKEA